MSIHFSTHRDYTHFREHWQSRRSSSQPSADSNATSEATTSGTQGSDRASQLAQDMFAKLDPNNSGSVSRDDFIRQMTAYLDAGRGLRGEGARHHHHHQPSGNTGESSHAPTAPATPPSAGQGLLDAITALKNGQSYGLNPQETPAEQAGEGATDNTTTGQTNQGELLLQALNAHSGNVGLGGLGTLFYGDQ